MRRQALIALILITAATTVFAAEDTIRRGFNVSDGGTLVLDAGYGDVKIVAGGTGVAVEVVRRGKRSEIQDHKVKFEQRGNDVHIDGTDDDDDRNRWFNWDFDELDVQWNIRVPARYSVNVKTSGGDVELSDIGGTTDVRTSGGDIEAGRLGGAVVLKTSGGDVEVASAGGKVVAHTSGGSIKIGDVGGPIEAKTSGGSISLARVSGEVYARTSGGGIRIEEASGRIDASTSGGSINATFSRQPNGDSRLSTSGGSVTIALAPSVAVDVDARASGGGVRSDVPVTVMGTQEDDELRGSVNGGGPKLVLRTSGGGIRLRKM